MKDLLNKITGNIAGNDYDNYDEYDDDQVESLWDEEETAVDMDQAMAVDVYQDENNLYIKAFVPGIDPNSIDVDISRDMITLKGNSFRESTVGDENYFQQELSWGAYARTISLPREIDIELADAKCRNGILSITLPKLDKDRRTKLRVT